VLILKVLLTSVHVLVSLVLIVSILLQASKGGGLASTFGGQAASVFGPRSAASALSTVTRYLAGVFLVLSFTLSMLAAGSFGPSSVTQRVLESSPASQLPSVEDLDLGAPSAPAPSDEAPVNPLEGSEGR